jgi:alpha-galactosidase
LENENVNDDFSKRDAKFKSSVYNLKNLWTKKDAGTTKEILEAEVPGRDVLIAQA